MATENELIASIARRHGVGLGAVSAALAALRRGNGTMAQFSHADFGGMAQWSKGGMSMVGVMFDSDLKTKLDGVMTDLAAGLSDGTVARSDRIERDGSPAADMSPEGQQTSAWPSEFGTPSSSGGQDDMRYAFFPKVQRLIVQDGSKRTTYDTGAHRISGVAQQKSATRSLRFQTQDGDVRLEELTVID